MAYRPLRDRRLVELYYRYVGEPERMRDVYGYWLFLLGCLAGLAGIILYLVEQALFPGDLAVREIAIVAAAFGLTMGLFGIVVLLPVRRNGIFAAILGLLIAFAGIGLFTWAYPHAWYVPPDYSPEIIAVYGTGVTLIAAVAVLVPIVTGERALFVEPELGIGSDEAPILLGKAERDAFFAVYQTPSKAWTWRMINRSAIAESTEVANSDTDTRMLVEDVRETIGRAGLLDLTTASFRLYQTDQNAWRWSLVRQDGSVVAVSNTEADTREEVESTVTYLKEQLPHAETIDIRGAAFDIFQDDADRWRWRLIDEDRRPLASVPDSLASRDAASEASRTFVSLFSDARVLAIEDVGVELFATEDGWKWRGVTASDETLVTSERAYEGRQAAEAAAERTAKNGSETPVVEYGTPGFELLPENGVWTWRLRSETDELVADAVGDPTDRETVAARAERTREVVGDATIFEFEGVDFEVYPSGETWHWRLVSADRTVLAESVEGESDEEAARAAASHVQERVLAADLIEFEQAAFQQYESAGEWRWRLIDEDGRVLADSGEEFGSKEAVREGMTTLKKHAPEAEVLEIDTAAFEIYQTESGEYAWRLIDEGGKLIAEGASNRESRADAREAVAFLGDAVGNATIRPMANAGFQLYQEESAWAGRLIDVDGAILAKTREPATTRDEAREAVERIRRAGSGASIDELGEISVVLREDSGWRWELVKPDRTRVASGAKTYEDRQAAMADIERFIEGGASAPTFAIGDGIVWARPDREEDTWRWRLVEKDRTVVGLGAESHDSLETLLDEVEMMKTRVPEAGTFEIETLAFELVFDGESWRWLVLDEDETILGESPGGHESQEDAHRGMDRAREAAEEASILEIDEPAFEFHEREDGWVWRLIDEHGTQLAESVQAHETRKQASEEMRSAKDFGPQGETVVTW